MIGQLQSGPVGRLGAVQQLCNAKRAEGGGGLMNALRSVVKVTLESVAKRLWVSKTVQKSVT